MFCTVYRQSLCVKMFSGLDLNQEGEAMADSLSLSLEGNYTRFECSFKPVLILHGWSILAKQCDRGWFSYDFT